MAAVATLKHSLKEVEESLLATDLLRDVRGASLEEVEDREAP